MLPKLVYAGARYGHCWANCTSCQSSLAGWSCTTQAPPHWYVPGPLQLTQHESLRHSTDVVRMHTGAPNSEGAASRRELSYLLYMIIIMMAKGPPFAPFHAIG